MTYIANFNMILSNGTIINKGDLLSENIIGSIPRHGYTEKTVLGSAESYSNEDEEDSVALDDYLSE